MGEEIQKTSNQKIANASGFTEQEVAIVKATVAKNTTNLELAYFLNVARDTELSPFNKEIWCYKDTKGNLIIFAGRDGFLKKAQRSVLWNGITSFSVHANDKFSMNIKDGKVIIEHSPDFNNPGALLGAYAIVKPKGCDLPTVEWATFKTFDYGYFVWKSHPDDLIK